MDIIIEQEIELHQIWFRNNKSVVKRLLHPEFREVEESGLSDQQCPHIFGRVPGRTGPSGGRRGQWPGGS